MKCIRGHNFVILAHCVQVIAFTSCFRQFSKLTSVTLKCRSRWTIYELVRGVHEMHPWNQFGDPSSLRSQVITFTSCFRQFSMLTSVTLKSRSRWPIYELVRGFHDMHPWNQYGDPSSLRSKLSRSQAVSGNFLCWPLWPWKVGQGDPYTNSSDVFMRCIRGPNLVIIAHCVIKRFQAIF